MSRNGVFGVLLLALALIAAACGDDAGETTEAPATTQAPATTEAPATTQAPATTEAPATTQAPTPVEGGPPGLRISAIAFSSNTGHQDRFLAPGVVITNRGTETVNLGGHWLCNQPDYFELPAVDLDVGDSLVIAAGDLSTLSPQVMEGVFVLDVISAGGQFGALAGDAGNMALYSSNDFTNPEAILSFVQWGAEGQGRVDVAISAEVWDGSAADQATGVGIVTSSANATTGGDWTVVDG